MKFASSEWYDAYKNSVNQDESVIKGFPDPESVNFNVEFSTGSDKFHFTLEKGKITFCGPPKFSENELDFTISADVQTWKTIASGEPISKMLTTGKVNVIKGPIDVAIKNAKGLDGLGRNIGNVPTEW